LEGPRYKNAAEVLQLATTLQGSAFGLSMEQLLERFDVSRKTLERRLRAVGDAFPARLVAETRDDGRKYWRLSGGVNAGLVGIDATELAALEAAVGRAQRPDQEKALRDLADKVRALQAESKARLETDAEALLEGEGIATRPGPRPRIDLDVVEALREGLLGCLRVRIRYRGRIKGDETTRVVHPYGFLFGGRHYLVAEDPAARELRMFALSNVLEAEVLDGYFERDEEFDLQAWAARSFGVYQEDPIDVVWRFSPEAADDAAEYQFHPSQETEREPDGSLLVRFRAGGLREMCWHAFEWRGQLQILEPPELREELTRMLEETLRSQSG
jgi:predicted DNA-binding transcriptional regulator YafY